MQKIDPDDYAIYPSADEFAGQIPWRIESYDEAGIFTANEKKALSEKFDLTSDLVQELSILIGNCLDEGSAINLFKRTKSKAIDKGTKIVKEELRNLRNGRNPQLIREMLSHLSTSFAENLVDASLLPRLLTAKHVNEEHLLQIINTPGSVAATTPDDKRNARDLRRYHVVASCCYIWLDAENLISYTTVSDGSKKVSGMASSLSSFRQ